MATRETVAIGEARRMQLALPWQASLWQQIVTQHDSGRLPHGVLLVGDAGLGKRCFAEALSQFLLCQYPDSGAACGKCKACELCMSGTHPDLYTLSPQEKSVVIKIDDLRAVLQSIQQTAQISGARVIMIEPAESMNLSSANALLKHLEEPGADTYFLLVSHRPGALPATVRSRCQRYTLGTPAQEEVIPWLAPLCGGKTAAVDLLRLTRGRPLAALAIAEQGGAETEQVLLEGFDKLLTGDITPSQLVGLLKGRSLESVVIRMLQYVEAHVSGSLPQIDGDPSKHAPALQFYSRLEQLHRRVSGGQNPNATLTLEDLSISLKEALGR